ncbi:MAG TPA: hypothetical protein VGB73_14630 [Pyrinomonadaceae bacterium]
MLTMYIEVLDLYNAAEAAYGNGQLQHAQELYRKALGIAEAHDEVPAWLKPVLRRAAADALVGADRLREALSLLAPLSDADGAEIKSCCVYGNLTDHIEIGQELPVSLPTIERAYTEAESYLRSAGFTSWKSRILFYKAELQLARGMTHDALSTAQEAWSVWEKDCPKLWGTTHLEQLFQISLALRDAAQAARYLRLWEEQEPREEKNYRIRESAHAQMKSKLARMERRLDEAVDYARRAVQSVELSDWGGTRYAAAQTCVRAFLVAGEHERARDLLARLSVMRRSESGHDRYAVQLLRGDYHLARARVAAHLPQADDEFDTDFTLPERTGHFGDAPRHELKKARTAYGAALAVGEWIDAQLQCQRRRREIAARLARVEAIERAPTVAF